MGLNHNMDDSDPMRITKKFAGASCIGKRVFMPVELTPENAEETARSRRDLEEMARKFHIRLESMRPGGGGSSSGRSNSGSSSKGASSSHSSPKTRKSSASAAGTGGGGGAACGTAKASQGGGGARRGEIVAPSLSGAGVEEDGDGGARRERSPSPGAHGPHSACDDSAPHPEGSPSRRPASSWEERDDADGEGYGQYDPMDQSLDSDASSSSSRATGYPGRVQQPPPGGGGGGGGYGGAAAAASAEYGMHGDRRDHVMGYDRCQWEERLSGVDGAVGGGGVERGGGRDGGVQEDVKTRYGGQHQQPDRQAQSQQHGHDGFFGNHGGARRAYNFQLGSSPTTGGDADAVEREGEEGETSTGAGSGRMSPRPPSPRMGGWARPSPPGSLGPVGGAPRKLPPSALSATVIRDGAGGGSGARSPTWPLPKVIPEGSEISDHDAGGLLIGFFQKVHEKAQTAADELGEVRSGTYPFAFMCGVAVRY